jgi:hypothetical protein
MNKSIFSILAYEKDKDDTADNGTGFFINSEGYFITAGHVINNVELKYYANINDELYPIKEIYREYIDQTLQKAPIFKDLFIGKVEYTPSAYNICEFSDAIEINEYYLACGFTSRNLIPQIKKPITFDELFEDDDLVSEDTSYNVKSKYKNLNFYEIEVQYYKSFIYRVFGGDIQYFENGLTVDMKKIIIAGMSGGPLMKENKVRGMVFARDNCISAAYIMSKLNELSIEYNK